MCLPTYQSNTRPIQAEHFFLGFNSLSGTSKGCVTLYYGLAIYIKKYLTAKEELWKLKYFIMQKYNLQKHCLKEKPKNPSRYYNSITNISSFNTSQNIIFQKSSYKNK
jgi:hypothetical protein